ncbi:hypothetical protein ABTD44_19735, partial [Acinetobacter baumannii]
EAMSRRKGRANYEIVAIDCQKGRIAAGQIGVDDPVCGEMLAEHAALDPARRILHDLLYQYAHCSAVIVATVRDVERTDKSAGRIANRCVH